MCGRFVFNIDLAKIKEIMKIQEMEEYNIDYNVSPGKKIFAIVNNENKRIGINLNWGLVTGWTKKYNQKRIINSRLESLKSKPVFRQSYETKRCIIPISGFYEWNTVKTPYYFYSKFNEWINLGGIWNTLYSEDGEIVNSCSIITTESNNTVKPIHHRMPLIIQNSNKDTWLNNLKLTSEQESSISNYQGENILKCHEVSNLVGSVKNNGSRLINPVNFLDLIDL